MSETIRAGQLYPNQIYANTFKKANNMKNHSLPSDVMSFSNTLQQEMLKFSHHAEARMAQRGISLPIESLTEINQAIDSAAEKGAKDSLIVYKDIAMIVNVPSRTVVTALDGKQLESNVFTQIDSAIILK